MTLADFWRKKKVFITGHTGFKGSWLCLLLHCLGAEVYGYALNPPTKPNLFQLAKIRPLINSTYGDVRNLGSLKQAMSRVRPDIAIHMAAQPLVRNSYQVPVETFSTNIMGTVNFLEAVRACRSVKAAINATTDKVYENELKIKNERLKMFAESDPLGGHDPYSCSKACSEIVTSAYQKSYGLNVATARAGNVIGGGDWAGDRLVPDFVRAILKGEKIKIRNPKAVRPWQFVLDPLYGYLLLAQKLCRQQQKFAEAWNFGPSQKEVRTVDWVVKRLCDQWGRGASFVIDKTKHPHEAGYLQLDSSKSRKRLGWEPKYATPEAIELIVEWTRAYKNRANIRSVCLSQIEEYLN